jgi:hypothetical protein
VKAAKEAAAAAAAAGNNPVTGGGTGTGERRSFWEKASVLEPVQDTPDREEQNQQQHTQQVQAQAQGYSGVKREPVM